MKSTAWSLSWDAGCLTKSEKPLQISKKKRSVIPNRSLTKVWSSNFFEVANFCAGSVRVFHQRFECHGERIN